MNNSLANTAGLAALIIWASTALVFTYCASVPPFLLASLTSFTAFCIFIVIWFLKGENIRENFLIPFPVVLFCVFGIGGYSLVYMMALGKAPVVEASLINYLWPLLVVLFSQFLPDHRLRWFHVLGALSGFGGLCVLLYRPEDFFAALQSGHLLALLAAFIWGGYSVLTRLFKKYSSNVIPVSFLYSGIILGLISTWLEPAWVIQEKEIPFIFLLGAISGAGYFLWDIGMKHGNIQLLGVSSYFAPLLSTILLFAFGKAEIAPHIIVASLLICLGPIWASQNKLVDFLKKRKRVRTGQL